MEKKKIDWARKLTSRKFWAAVIGFVTPVMTLAQVPDNTAVQVTSIIMAGEPSLLILLGKGLPMQRIRRKKSEKRN